MLLTCLLEKAFGLNLILHKAKLTYQLGCDCIGVFRQINNLTNTPLWHARLIIQNKLSYEFGEIIPAFKASQRYILTEVLKFSYPLCHRNGDPVPWEQWKSEVKKKILQKLKERSIWKWGVWEGRELSGGKKTEIANLNLIGMGTGLWTGC